MQTAFCGSRRRPFGRATATNRTKASLGEFAERDAGIGTNQKPAFARFLTAAELSSSGSDTDAEQLPSRA